LKWLRRELLVLIVFGGFGLLVLPALVFMVGQELLGEYRPGAGTGEFYADLYRYLGNMEPFAWLLVLGPYLGVQLLRLLWLPLGLLTRRRPPPRRESPPDRRIEPVI
jgi:hypothetical protein